MAAAIGIGALGIVTGGVGPAVLLSGGIISTGGVVLMKTANSRLKEAKINLVIQIKQLIK